MPDFQVSRTNKSVTTAATRKKSCSGSVATRWKLSNKETKQDKESLV